MTTHEEILEKYFGTTLTKPDKKSLLKAMAEAVQQVVDNLTEIQLQAYTRHREELAAKDKEIERVNKVNCELFDGIRDAKKEIASTEKICNDHMDTIDILQKERTEMQKEIAELKQQIEWWQKQNWDLKINQGK